MAGETTRPYVGSGAPSVAFEDVATRVIAQSAPQDAWADGDTVVAPRADSPPTAPEERQLPAGTRVGRYLVLGHIGSGGLGDVYAAFDSELDRKVAIKLLRPSAYDKSLGDPTQRLLREAQALAKLRHPNIVTVFDVGTFRDEVFVAMEFVEGQTITVWLRKSSPTWQAIRDVYLLAGEGVAAAHAAGLVHRDFKLDNVVVNTDGRVTVLDFGLARAIAQRDATDGASIPLHDADTMHTPLSSLLDRDVTRASLVLGTPPYMSPELLAGEPASASSDQFAFCVALFKSLYRRLPFASTTLAEHYNAVLAGQITSTPDEPRVPGWLRKVVERGLAADPQRRHRSMEALLDAMRADRRRRRRILLTLAIAVPLTSVAIATVAVATRPEPTQTERAQTLELAEAARAAAANGYYVFPPADAPDTPTALTKVVELENLSGTAGDEGRRLGQALRTELSDALARLGDRYYDRPGGPAFAADFYAAAIVFDPNHPRARQRVALTPGQLAELGRRAREGDFTTGELQAAEALALLAVEDEGTRAERVRTYFEARDVTSATQPALLEAVLDDDERALAETAIRARAKKRRKELEPAPLEVDVAPVPPTVVPDPGPAGTPTDLDLVNPFGSPQPATPWPPRPAPDTDTPARWAQAKLDAKAGTQALQRGQLAPAETLFNRALGNNRRNVEALAGLAEIHFERGDHEQALNFAKKAVAVSPKSGRLYVTLGDCYVKLLRYDNARTAYQTGMKAGSKIAGARLQRLDAKLGQ